MRDVWAALDLELRAVGSQLVLLSNTPTGASTFPVLHMPFALKDLIGWFPAEEAGRSGTLSPEDLALAECDRAWRPGAYASAAATAGLSACRHAARALLQTLKPGHVLLWDTHTPSSSVLQQLCWQTGVPVLGLERGVLPETLMVDSRAPRGFSDLRTHWLAEGFVPPADARLHFEAAQRYYREHRPQKYDQPAFGGGGDALRAQLGLGSRRVVVAFGFQEHATVEPYVVPNIARYSAPVYPSNRAGVLALGAALREGPEVALVFKPHPSDQDRYADLREQGVILIRQANIHALIDLAEVVAGQLTTVLVEALLYDKPVLEWGQSVLTGRGIAYEVNHPSTMAAQIRAALARHERVPKEDRAHEFIAWMLDHYLIACKPGVPARKGLRDFARFLARTSLDAGCLPPAAERLANTRRILTHVHHQKVPLNMAPDASQPAEARSPQKPDELPHGFSLLDRLPQAKMLQGQPDQYGLWEAQIDGQTSSCLHLPPPAQLQFVLPCCNPGQFSTAVCIHPDAWTKPNAGGCEFRVRVDGRLWATVEIDPSNRPQERKWHEINFEVPASPHEHHKITLETRFSGTSQTFAWAIWRAPCFHWLGDHLHHPPISPTAQFYLNRAEESRRRGEWASARKDLEFGLELEPDSIELSAELARCLAETNPVDGPPRLESLNSPPTAGASAAEESLLEITKVTVVKEHERLWGWHLEAPSDHAKEDVFALTMSGWVLGRSARIASVRVMDQDNLVAEIPVQVQRPDIVKAFPQAANSERCGFSAPIGVLGLPTEFELVLQAVVEDGTRFHLGSIQGQRAPLASGFQAKLQPLILTSLGRAGSTWVTLLLGRHPQMMAYRPFSFEPRFGEYWMQILKVLSNPSSYLQGLVTDLSNRKWWLGEQLAKVSLADLEEPVRRCLGHRSIVASVRFCQNQIEEFYKQVAAVQHRQEAVYFVEKHSTNPLFRRYLLEFYPKAREIFLVRDFRDMVCSMFAYNAKTGSVGFGYKDAKNDEDFFERKREEAFRFLKSWKSHSRNAYLLRYEDLVLHPAETLQSTLDYLGLDSSQATVERMLQQAATSHQEGQQFHQTASNPRASIGRWRADLPPALQAKCQEVFADVLKEFGYA